MPGGCRHRGAAPLAAVLGVVLAAALPSPGLPARAAEPRAEGSTTAVAAADPLGATHQPAAAVPGPRVVWRGPRTERVVALTFDDGWNPATLRSIHAILVREDVPATFFVNGAYMQRAPDLWRLVATRFPLANHSFRHRDMRALDDEAVLADLARTRTVVEATTGQPMLPYFRPPYGSRDARTDRLAAQAGFPTIVMWNVDGADTSRRSSTADVIRIASRGRPGSIVLLHAGPRVTVRALPGIIAAYRARGFRFVALSELIGTGGGPPLAEAAGPVDAGRPLDRADDAPRGATPLRPGSTGRGDGEPSATPPAPAAPLPAPTPPQRARDAAWARSAGTPWALAVGTAGLLAGLLVLAALAGRGRRPEDGPGDVGALPGSPLRPGNPAPEA